MDLATVIALITMSKSLVELGQEIAKAVEKAKSSPDVVRRVLLYMEAVQASVNGLGLERQYILTDVRSCDIGNAEQVNALWKRLDRYLHEDNIRHHLVPAVDGLRACHEPIERTANSAWRRKRDKAVAVKGFSTTLELLEKTLDDLTANFYPGGSGWGVLKLLPIYEKLNEIRQAGKLSHCRAAEIHAANQKLGELARKAVRHRSHEEWFKTTGKVEALVTQLQLAFDVKVAETARNDS